MNTNRSDQKPAELPLLTGDTRLSVVLDAVPGALEWVVALRPHDFERLHNPFMRRYMPARISLRRVARMAEVPEAQLLRGLRALAGQSAPEKPLAAPEILPQSPPEPPFWMDEIEADSVRRVDVRPIDDVLGDPFPPISIAIKRMSPGEVIVLLHRWEPQPLYDIWAQMNIEWFSRQKAANEWHVFIHKPPTHPVPAPALVVVIELRHLSPEEAAPRVVAMFEQLRYGQTSAAPSLDISGASTKIESQIRNAMEARHGGAFVWTREAGGQGKTRIRITANQ